MNSLDGGGVSVIKGHLQKALFVGEISSEKLWKASRVQ